MPPAEEMKARVDFIYSDELPEKDQAEFWKKFGKKRNSALESFVGKRNAMQAAVSQIVSPNDTQEVKLRKIYDRVQQLRNTSYELRKTEQEEKRDKEKLAANVEDVWKRGYGDGVQLTWLYLALVRAAGFEAYGCWVSESRQLLFHACHYGKQEIGCQTSSWSNSMARICISIREQKFTPFGLLTWTETGTAGLKLDGDGGSWIQTILPESSESQIQRTAKLKLSDTGDLEGKLTVTYTGLEAMYRRLNLRHADEVARKKILEDQVKEQVPASSELELTNKPDWDGAETPLVAEFDMKAPGWASSAGKRAMLPVGFFTVHEKRIFEHGRPRAPDLFRISLSEGRRRDHRIAPGLAGEQHAEAAVSGHPRRFLRLESGKRQRHRAYLSRAS